MSHPHVKLGTETLLDPELLELDLASLLDFALPLARFLELFLDGGAGAGVSVQPVGFLLVGDKDIRFQVVDHSALLDRLIDEVPQMVEKLKQSKQSRNADLFAQQFEKAIYDSFPQNMEQ